MRTRKFILLLVLFNFSIAKGATEISLGVNSIPQPVDSHFTRSTNHTQILRQIYEPLFLLTESYKVESPFFKSWTVNTERTVYSFELKQGLRFWDGAEVRSNHIEAIFFRKSPGGEFLFPEVKNVEVDGQTIRVALKRPDGLFLHKLTDLPAAVLSNKTGPAKFLIGTGAFSPSLIDDQSLLLIRNPYHRHFDVGNLTKIHVRLLGKTVYRLSELRESKIDFFPLIRVIEDEEAKVNYRRAIYPSQRVNLLILNIENKDIRDAVYACIDWSQFLKMPYFNGNLIGYNAIIPPGIENFHASSSPLKRPTKESCKAQLRKFKSLTEVEFLNNYTDPKDIEFISQILADFNSNSKFLKVRINTKTLSEAHELIKLNKHQLYLCGVSSPFPLADGIFSDFTSSSNNDHRLLSRKIPQFEKLLKHYRTAEGSSRLLYIERINRHLLENNWIIPIGLRREAFYIPKSWKNLQMVNAMNGNFYLGEVLVHEPQN